MSEHTEEHKFTSEDFSKKSLEHFSFSQCIFHRCDFSDTILRNAKFSFCTFEHYNLSLAKVDDCRFQDVFFTGCKMLGIGFFKCDTTFFSVKFKDSVLQDCNFSEIGMKNVIFKTCKLKDSHFTQTCLIGADFSDTDLSGTVFHNCDLSKADFSTATCYNLDPQTNKIKKAKFSLPEALKLLKAFDIMLI